jgi:hypothetical protein
MGAAASAAAAEARRRKQQEEEEITPYSRDELSDDWEFKIVRSSTGAFGKPATFNRLIEEEARAGWQRVEKFDNNRVRFKRPRSARRGDAGLAPGVDPYRVEYGLSEGALVVVILGAVFGSIALVMLIIFMVEAAGR